MWVSHCTHCPSFGREDQEIRRQEREQERQDRIEREQRVSPTDQIRIDEAEREARGRQESARSAVTLAKRLQDNEATKRLFGRIEGRTPDIDQDVIDADADRLQLVEILTLANTDRMTGVLSESDIQILRAAGTLLENRLISDERAEQEIQNVIEVFQRNPEVQGIVDEVLNEGDSQEIPEITSQEEFDALPSGAIFMEDGQQYRKP